MKIKKKTWQKIIKNKNFIIAFSVFVLTIITIGVSYASFFSIKTNTNNQSVSTGTLEVYFDPEKKNSVVNKNNMEPMSNEEGMAQGESSYAYIQNTGTLNADFVMSIGYDMENFLNRSGYSANDQLTPVDYIMVAVYQYNGAGVEPTLIAGPISVADLPIYKLNSSDNRYNRYAILFNNVGSTSSESATKKYIVKTWLSDKAIPSVSYTYFYVNMEVVAKVEDAQNSYNWSGTLLNAAGTKISGAKIDLQNSSVVTTTDANGAFNINNLYPGTYNLTITYNNVIYNGNLTIKEGSKKELKTYTTFNTGDIFNASATYGVPIAKIIKTNALNSYSTALNLSGTYNLPTNYEINLTENDTEFSTSIKLSDTNFTITLT